MIPLRRPAWTRNCVEGRAFECGVIDLDPEHALDTTIADLRDLDPPNDIRHFEGRAHGVEDQLFVVEGTLTMFKSESDEDFHLVLKDRRKSMIAEIPKPSCVTTSSPFHDAVRDVHQCFSDHFGGKKSKKNLHLRVRVTGVGFFDLPHSTPQTGHAPNNIEIHPVLGIMFLEDEVECGEAAQFLSLTLPDRIDDRAEMPHYGECRRLRRYTGSGAIRARTIAT